MPKKFLTRVLAPMALVLSMSLVGCAPDKEEPVPAPESAVAVDPAAQEILVDEGLEGLGVRELIETLDATPKSERSSTLMASVQPNELVLSDDQGREASIPMPEDEIYIAIAPFLDRSHECHFHSLTTCVGELGNTPVNVSVTDLATGEVIYGGEIQTHDNGFLGVWLPKAGDVEVMVAHEGRQATTVLATSGDDIPTCITTMQLF